MRSFAVLFTLLTASACATAAAEWRAGAAKVRITPSGPVWMAGYDARTQPSSGVLNDIWVRALALRAGDGPTSVILTMEVVGVPRSLGDEFARRMERRGVARDRLLLNASHTHSAPMAGAEWIERSRHRLNDEQAAISLRYTAWLIDRMEEAAAKAIDNLAPARLAYGQGFAGIAVNRRRVGALERPGPVDQDVHVLSVHGEKGELRAILLGYACHATVLSGYEINGDFPGFAQTALETAHPTAVALFLQGCGADSNPLPRRTVELARAYGGVLAAAVEEVLKGRMRPLAPALACVIDSVDVRFRTPPTRAQLEEERKGKDPLRQRHAAMLLEVLAREGRIPDTYPFLAQVWRVGPDLTLIALAGEVVVEYSLRFKAAYGWGKTWVAGYSNDVFAYIPSVRVLREGGYEGGEAMLYRPLAGPFDESIEETIANKVDELVKRVNAPAAR
jgi:hypothetical protein